MKRAVEGELSVLQKRVELWRKHRERGRARIPEELWKAAVEVARVEGVHATCRALSFDYNRLRDRVALAKSKESEPLGAATFIELGSGALGGSGKTVVELVGRRGGRMRVDVSGPSAVDVVGLAQAFWSHEA